MTSLHVPNLPRIHLILIIYFRFLTYFKPQSYPNSVRYFSLFKHFLEQCVSSLIVNFEISGAHQIDLNNHYMIIPGKKGLAQLAKVYGKMILLHCLYLSVGISSLGLSKYSALVHSCNLRNTKSLHCC